MTFEPMSDAALLTLAENGDEGAFATLFDRYRDRVYYAARRLIDNSTDAEDVTAMVFLEAWRGRRKMIVINGSLLPWLLTTTLNVARNARRSKARYRVFLDSLPDPGHAPDHADDVAASVDRVRGADPLAQAFRSLSKNDQLILLLCVVEELRVQDAAAYLGVPEGTVKSRLSRAKNRLRLAVLQRRGASAAPADASAITTAATEEAEGSVTS
ncbi:RNA polymerase sigma factor [Compostimonas suwonensis]|uniref:RNA polymerase sigma-70 factor (ECF subfamily) n=1 Tax=Compostimonas suwonensis TaxID=1048394 RepID=A0A2M9C081_9MICO|nr:RNA polymerase sigma factor [Compostimonas suwonensis]PJJ63728.1 RNA polymerase sigma-70 factor (ECF subfamily) [Compostimonas suwonensis]